MKEGMRAVLEDGHESPGDAPSVQAGRLGPKGRMAAEAEPPLLKTGQQLPSVRHHGLARQSSRQPCVTPRSRLSWGPGTPDRQLARLGGAPNNPQSAHKHWARSRERR